MENMEEIYRALLESTGEGIVIVDEEGNVLMFNHTAENLFGFRREEILNRKVDSLLPEFRADLPRHPAANSGELTRLELMAKRGDGTEFPVAVALSLAGTDQRRKAV